MLTIAVWVVEPDYKLLKVIEILHSKYRSLTINSDHNRPSSSQFTLAALDAALRTEYSLDRYTEVVSGSIDESSARLDVDQLCKLGSPQTAFEIILWSDKTSAKDNDRDKDIFALYQRNPTTWAFWRQWYQGFLDGKPLDWELQRRVALIADPIWEAGPEAVAEEIERIRAAFEVEQRAEALEDGARQALKSTRGIGDNQPPEPIEDALASSDGVAIIWAAARDLKEEAQSDTPDKGRVRKAIDVIAGVMRSCGLWAAKKADIGVNAAMGAIGAAGGTVAVAWITQNGDKIIELIEAAKVWLGLL